MRLLFLNWLINNLHPRGRAMALPTVNCPKISTRGTSVLWYFWSSREQKRLIQNASNSFENKMKGALYFGCNACLQEKRNPCQSKFWQLSALHSNITMHNVFQMENFERDSRGRKTFWNFRKQNVRKKIRCKRCNVFVFACQTLFLLPTNHRPLW